ncbi:MarR family transcriptional regulator [Amycolatopsis acidiphila]|nr:MarR family transcriptional regulator [Amycolatopsis acidiphila]UIJ57056.1 MarR family transcriptional regulator [Amycolatopsis acidiphila]GHG53611.1 MarR family transcriptional regulator [Amycolatopsis acidiphila]
MAEIKTPSRESARVAAELKVAVGRLVRRLRQAHAPGELTLSEMSVLSRLDREGPAAPGALADAEAVRPQAMASTLAALEQRGMVDRAPDAADGRRVVMTPTEAGRAVIHDRRSASVQRLALALEEGFTAAERRELLAVVPLLERLAEQL